LNKKANKYSVLKPGYQDEWSSHEGDYVRLKENKSGQMFLARIRIKSVRCGKAGCTKCPHHQYAYAQFRDGKKVKEKYLGIAR